MAHPLRSVLLASLLAAAPALSQGRLPAGFKDLAFPNTTGRGSATLLARVHYPARSPGANAPLLPRPGGWPVIVFLHGFAALGRFYPELGNVFAAHGYVAVLGDTAQFSSGTQTLDGIALFPALRAANARAGSFLNGALDMRRAGVCGHSMGGGSTVRVLAANPGYRAGFGFAPVFPGSVAGAVRVPFGLVQGTGDRILPVQRSGDLLYPAITGHERLKVFYRMNDDCNHLDVAGLFLFSQRDREVWQRCASVATGFFDRFVKGEPAGLERVLGPAARAEPRLDRLLADVEAPDLWNAGARSIGKSALLRVLAEPGPAALAAAARTGSRQTPFGPLLLDPATLAIVAAGRAGPDRLLSAPLAIPDDARLIGAELPLQGVGPNARGALELTALVTLAITR